MRTSEQPFPGCLRSVPRNCPVLTFTKARKIPVTSKTPSHTDNVFTVHELQWPLEIHLLVTAPCLLVFRCVCL